MENDDVVKEIKENTQKIAEKTDRLSSVLTKKMTFFEKLKSYVYNFWIVSILIILLVIDIAVHIPHVVIDEQNLVLGFIGAIATLVVVSNYMQVLEIRREFESKVSGVESKVSGVESKVSGVESKMEALRSKFAGIKGELTVLSNITYPLQRATNLSAQASNVKTKIEKLLLKITELRKGLATSREEHAKPQVAKRDTHTPYDLVKKLDEIDETYQTVIKNLNEQVVAIDNGDKDIKKHSMMLQYAETTIEACKAMESSVIIRHGRQDSKVRKSLIEQLRKERNQELPAGGSGD